MKLFTLFKGNEVRLSPGAKIIPASEFSTLMDSKEIQTIASQEALDFREEVAKECEILKEQAELAGFDEGLRQWNSQIAYLEKETKKVSKEMENAIVPLALAAVKKIIGREIELKPDTIVDIVATALKTVSQHHRIAIYVNKADLEIVDAHRARLKEIFDHLHSMTISSREDILPGGCIIETEVGIINAQLNNQLNALEAAFHSFLQSHNKKAKE